MCNCHVKFFGKMGMILTGTERWLVLLLSLTDGLGVFKSVSLKSLDTSSFFGYFSLMSKKFVMGSDSM